MKGNNKIDVYMTMSMVEHFNTYGCDYKDHIDKVYDDGSHGNMHIHSGLADLYKVIKSIVPKLPADGWFAYKYQYDNKSHIDTILVRGFFDATEYVLRGGDLTYLANFMLCDGIVRIDGTDFAGVQQQSMMRDAANALKMKNKNN